MTHRIHPAERDVHLLLNVFKDESRRIDAERRSGERIIIRLFLIAVSAFAAIVLLATLAHAHPGDHDHCEQTSTGTHQCH